MWKLVKEHIKVDLSITHFQLDLLKSGININRFRFLIILSGQNCKVIITAGRVT
jgi:hypothetical protein